MKFFITALVGVLSTLSVFAHNSLNLTAPVNSITLSSEINIQGKKKINAYNSLGS